MRPSIVSFSALFAVGDALMGRNMHDPFQAAIRRVDDKIAMLEAPLQDNLNQLIVIARRHGAHDAAQRILSNKSSMEQQFVERMRRYADKARPYIRAQEKFFRNMEVKPRPEAIALGITEAEVADMADRKDQALNRVSLVTDKFIYFVKRMAKGLEDFVREPDQAGLYKKIIEVLQMDGTVKKHGRRKRAGSSSRGDDRSAIHYDETEATQKSIKKLMKFVSLVIAKQYVSARGVIFDPREEEQRWEGFMDCVRRTLAKIPVVGPKSQANGSDALQISLGGSGLQIRLRDNKKALEKDGFLMKMVDRFRLAHNDRNDDGKMGAQMRFGPGTIVAYWLRSGDHLAPHSADRFIDHIKGIKGLNVHRDPFKAMADTVRKALQFSTGVGFREYGMAWEGLDTNSKYYMPGVMAQVNRELEAFNAIEDFFLLFEQPRHCGSVKGSSKTAKKDCEAYLRAIDGFKSAEIDRLGHRMQRVYHLVDLIDSAVSSGVIQYDPSGLNGVKPIADPNNPGQALTPQSVRQIPYFREFLYGLAPREADAQARLVSEVAEMIETHLDKLEDDAKLDGIPTATGRLLSPDEFASELVKLGFNKHDAKKLFDNFKEAKGDAPGKIDAEARVKALNEQLENEAAFLNQKLIDEAYQQNWAPDGDEVKARKQQYLAHIEAKKQMHQQEINRVEAFHTFNGKSMHWMGRLWEVVHRWSTQMTQPSLQQGPNNVSVKPATHVRPDQLVFYPEVKSALDAILNLHDTTPSFRLAIMALQWGYDARRLKNLVQNLQGPSMGVDKLMKLLLDFRVINDVSEVDLRSWKRYLISGYRPAGERLHDKRRLKKNALQEDPDVSSNQLFEIAIYCAKLWGHRPDRRNNVIEKFMDIVKNFNTLHVFVPDQYDQKKKTVFHLMRTDIERDSEQTEHFDYLLSWLKSEAHPSAPADLDQDDKLVSLVYAGNEVSIDGLKNGWNLNPQA